MSLESCLPYFLVLLTGYILSKCRDSGMAMRLPSAVRTAIGIQMSSNWVVISMSDANIPSWSGAVKFNLNTAKWYGLIFN